LKLRRSEAVLILVTVIFIIFAAVLTFIPTRSPRSTLVSTDLTVSQSELLTSADGIEAAEGVGIININSADAEKLCHLPGIGQELAKRIIDARPFNTPEDIMKVPGIGEKTFESIRELITCQEEAK